MVKLPLSAENQAAMLNGIASQDSVFYAIGGAILVVMAGIWGFNQVMSLLTGRDPDNDDIHDEDSYVQEEYGGISQSRREFGGSYNGDYFDD